MTVQACQQHRLAVMHPNKAKSFPAATVVGTPPPLKMWDPKREKGECLEGTREKGKVSTMEKSRRGGSAAPNTSKE